MTTLPRRTPTMPYQYRNGDELQEGISCERKDEISDSFREYDTLNGSQAREISQLKIARRSIISNAAEFRGSSKLLD